MTKGTMGKTISLAFTATLSLFLLTGFGPTPKGKIAVGNMARLDVYEKIDRYPVLFDHDGHSEELGAESCVDCHTLFDAEAKKKVFRRPDFGAQEMTDRMHATCIGCHETRSADGLKAGPQNCNGCHAKRKVPTWVEPVSFEHAWHIKIMERGQACDSCHHVWDEKLKKAVYVKGKEAACIDCHGDPLKEDAKTVQRLAVHTTCFGCHRAEAEKKQKTGPVKCAGCHDPREYPKPSPAPVTEQPKYKKKDTILITRADGIMPDVPFLHKVHQEKNDKECNVCHNIHVFTMADHLEDFDMAAANCNLCHKNALPDIKGDEKQRLSVKLCPDAVYHDEKSPSSCVGCHKAKNTKGPKTAAPCTGCHSGEEGLKALLKGKPLQEAAPWPEKGPDIIKIDRLAKRFQAVKYPHKKHREMLVECEACHHYVNPEINKTKTPACNVCHGAVFDPEKPEKPGLVGSYHQMCLGCHTDMGTGPVSCEKCHAKVDDGNKQADVNGSK